MAGERPSGGHVTMGQVMAPLRLSILVWACAACSASSCSSNGSSPAAQIRGGTAAAPPAAATAPQKPSALSAADVESYFQSGAAAEAARLYGLDQFDAARQKYREALSEDGLSPEQRSRLELMAAVTSALVQDWPAAVSGFDKVAGDHPLLADWISYQLARAHFSLGQLDQARKHAEAVAEDAVQRDLALLLLGDILRQGHDHRATAALYRDYLERKGAIRRPEARYFLGEALYKAGDLEQAADNLRILTVHAPLTSWTDKAKELLAAIVPRLPGPAKRRITSWTGADYLARAMAYYDENRSELAIADFNKALAQSLDTDARCSALYHQANSWWRLRNRTNAAPIFEKAIETCAKTDNRELQVKSLFQAGRSYDKLDQEETSIERLAAVEKQFPDHSYADDARLGQAESYEELGDMDKMREVLASIPERYPDGDMKELALWRLAWSEYKEKNYQKAIGWLEKQLAANPVPDSWERAGQAHYWLARSHGHLGQTDKAVGYYRDIIRLFPLSYYALLSLNRLRESHPDEFAAAIEEIQAEPADPTAGSFAFRPRPEYETERFRRALEMMRLGLNQAAAAELSELGFRAPGGKDRLTDEDDIDKTWAYAFLFHHAAQHSRALWVTRWHVLDYKRHWPLGAWRAKWDIAYPKAYWNLLDTWAKKRGHPTELQIAFVREESGFEPLLESWANAIGLTQMIIPTAERFARGTGIAATRENLRDPEKNVTIGSGFLAFLYKKFGGKIALIVPSYNTGENRVDQWLKEKPDMKRDEFSEDIPYDEPNRYNKRVTESYFVYSYLKDGTIPEMPND